MQNEFEKYINANRDAFNNEEPGAQVWQNLEKRFVTKQGALEQFVQANRDAFDNEEPGAGVWKNLEKTFVQPQATSNELEKFIKANKDAFDSEQPSARVLENIEKTFASKQEKKAPVIYRSLVVKMMSAAAIIFLVSVSVWYFTDNKTAITTGVQSVAQGKKGAITAPVNNDTNTVAVPTIKPSDEDRIASTNPVVKDNSTETNVSAEDDQTQEIFYYTKLTEIKFRELKKIEKEQPVLYKSFAGEIKKLDSAYHGLQTMLKGNADKETVLAAMITNLKMQTEILSKQLYIIHSLKKSKQNNNENNNKSI